MTARRLSTLDGTARQTGGRPAPVAPGISTLDGVARQTGGRPAPVAPGRATAGPPAAAAPGRERVLEIQRTRIIVAMSELVYEQGVALVTVAHVVERSGVSRRTFYQLFEDRDDCLLAVFAHAIDRAATLVLAPYRAAADSGWEQQMRAGLAALLEFLDAEPALGRLCVVDALAAGPAVLARRARLVDVLVDAVHHGARRGQGGRRHARLVAEGVVGGVLGVIYVRLAAREERPLTGLLNELMAIIVLPYLGSAVAARERARAAPRRKPGPRRNGDPLRGLGMRLTYRTVRVLLATAEHPAASGRQIADAAGVQDQGQISKLLSRLEHLGLIANDAPRCGRGEPNAWALTAKGREVEQALRAQTGP